MRKPPIFATLLLLAAAIGWGLYWFTGAFVMEKALDIWLEDRRGEGWVAEVTARDTRGFPNRFDTTFEGLHLADPDTQVAWSAPLFQILSLSYRPTHVIAVWPGEHVFSTPDQSITVTSETMRGSIVSRADLALPVSSSTIEIAQGSFASSQGWTATVAEAQFAMRESPEAAAPNTYDLHITAHQVNPGRDVLARAGSVAGLPDVIDGLTISATTRYDAPWDRFAIEVARPQPRSILLEKLDADWGDLALTASGWLEVGADAIPTGEIDIIATNWRDMVEIAVATGALNEAFSGPLTGALELVARLSGDPSTLDATLRFERGRAYLGPVQIGPAPEIRLP